MTEIKYGGTLENIKEKIKNYTLEDCSEIRLEPHFRAEKYKNCVLVQGNFKEYSNSFFIVTDEEQQITELVTLFRANKWGKGLGSAQ